MAGVYSVKRDVISCTVFSLRDVTSSVPRSCIGCKILLKAFFVRNGNTAKSFYIVRNGNTAKIKEGRKIYCRNKRRQNTLNNTD
jgi:hypothetical protein